MPKSEYRWATSLLVYGFGTFVKDLIKVSRIRCTEFILQTAGFRVVAKLPVLGSSGR